MEHSTVTRSTRNRELTEDFTQHRSGLLRPPTHSLSGSRMPEVSETSWLISSAKAKAFLLATILSFSATPEAVKLARRSGEAKEAGLGFEMNWITRISDLSIEQ
eukprot:scaffold55597_cov68-Cyclotella_meneghiniana.AAC.3